MIDLEFVGDYRNPQQLTARQRELGFDGSSAGEFSFVDFLDIINPLQHIPGISSLYRAITGDEIAPHARVLGGTLFGGPSGFVSAAVNTLFDEVAGGDIGETMIALFTGEDTGDTPQFADSGAAAVIGDAPLETAAAAEVYPAAVPDDFAAAGPGMLTGQDALAALFNDLRGPRPPEAPAEAAPAPQGLPLDGARAAAGARSYPLPPRSAPAAAMPLAEAPGAPQLPPAVASADHPLILAQESGDAGIAQHMMRALDQYQAMSQQRRGAEKSGADRADDEARWQSDPLVTGGDS
jgi:hypothetical protein